MLIKYSHLGTYKNSIAGEPAYQAESWHCTTRFSRHLPLLAVALFLVASIVGSGSVDAQILSAAKKSSDALSKEFIWATSGVELSDGSGVLVLDAGENQVMRIQEDGWVFEALTSNEIERGGLKKIHATADGERYLLLRHVNQKPEISFYTETEGSSGIELQPTDETVGLDDSVVAVYDFIALRDGLVLFADAYYRDQAVTGLFYIEYGAGGKIELINVRDPVTDKALWKDAFDPALQNYIKDDTRQYLTSVDGTGFFLALAERPWFGRIDVDKLRVELVSNVPDSHAFFPEVAATQAWMEAQERNRGFGGINLVRVFFEVIESVPQMVAGIYPGRSALGQAESSLFLLVRSQASEKEADWTLIELGASSGRELNRGQLPTRAAHLLVIPGEYTWTLLEKGALEPINIGFGESAPFLRTDSLTRMSPPTPLAISEPITKLASAN